MREVVFPTAGALVVLAADAALFMWVWNDVATKALGLPALSFSGALGLLGLVFLAFLPVRAIEHFDKALKDC